MAKRNATGSKSSLVTNPENIPAASSSKNPKRRRMCDTQSYTSPLVHLRKSNLRSRPRPASDDLDDSVIVLEEVTGLSLSNNPVSLAGKKTQLVNPDKSVIILSDNEENEVEKETDLRPLSLRTVVEDDNLSTEKPAPAEVRKVGEKIKSRFRTKTTLNGSASREKKSSTAGFCPNSDKVELQSISIDSEDENTIPNDDSSRLHSQAEIIIVDNSSIEINKCVSVSTISRSCSAESSSGTDDLAVVFDPTKEFQTTAEQYMSLRSEKKIDKRGKCPAFCIDTKGDPSLALPCSKSLSARRRNAKRKKALQNPNWATFIEKESSRSLRLKKLNFVDSQAQVDGIENSHRLETVVTNGSPETLLTDTSTVVATNVEANGVESRQRDETAMTKRLLESSFRNELTCVRNNAHVHGSCSYQRKETAVTNGTTESSHPQKLNVVTNQSKSNAVGSCHSGKPSVINGFSKILPANKMRSEKIQARDNVMGSYYSEQSVVNIPGTLREIIIDGCNIATQYTKGQYFSEEGLKLVIDYFELRGHTVKAFVPQHVRSVKNVILERLYSVGVVVFTPSRKIGGKRISSYDDRYILDYAAMTDGIVVSQDQYRDLYVEKPIWRRIIEERLLVPTFVGKCVMFPEDPLGRNGPTLDQFLRH